MNSLIPYVAHLNKLYSSKADIVKSMINCEASIN